MSVPRVCHVKSGHSQLHRDEREDIARKTSTQITAARAHSRYIKLDLRETDVRVVVLVASVVQGQEEEEDTVDCSLTEGGIFRWRNLRQRRGHRPNAKTETDLSDKIIYIL